MYTFFASLRNNWTKWERKKNVSFIFPAILIEYLFFFALSRILVQSVEKHRTRSKIIEPLFCAYLYCVHDNFDILPFKCHRETLEVFNCRFQTKSTFNFTGGAGPLPFISIYIVKNTNMVFGLIISRETHVIGVFFSPVSCLKQYSKSIYIIF